MKAADVMTRQVITVMPDATIEEAARLMLRHRISGLPVADRNGVQRPTPKNSVPDGSSSSWAPAG
jgi:CBS domain-containing protein